MLCKVSKLNLKFSLYNLNEKERVTKKNINTMNIKQADRWQKLKQFYL